MNMKKKNHGPLGLLFMSLIMHYDLCQPMSHATTFFLSMYSMNLSRPSVMIQDSPKVLVLSRSPPAVGATPH